ncbi:gene transfer agent family protein [Aquamicrobium sp. LC103]|uniref:gene transfer agent family protein n=1 Tax=Aquamicrobium sp. LC103 TaxID=1120658 RepID=UPI00063EB01C|nr:gene transfer agent family protein [Aquamicrobium sp. LC103]TKT78424.1 gene transfer agent family protein [Aquamicrobium sp. LC103]
MSRFATYPFGGKQQAFRLGIGELRELQELVGAGPSTILARLMSFQPQAQGLRRPQPDDYPHGHEDPDFIADFNTYAMLRGIGGDWRIDDIRETIRLGLIGAGMTPTDAFVAVSRYVDQTDKYPPVDYVGLAAGILIHALTGPKEDPVGKPKTGKTKTRGAASSSSRSSTA